jgi:hypothetical protein
MQAVDKFGAADFLGITVATLNRRIASAKFPPPDDHSSANGEPIDWWAIDTLERYQRSRNRKPRKRVK